MSMKRCELCEGPEHRASQAHVFGSAAVMAWSAKSAAPPERKARARKVKAKAPEYTRTSDKRRKA